VKKYGGSGEAQAMAAGAVTIRGGGTAEETAGAATKAGLAGGVAAETVQMQAKQAKKRANDGGLLAAIYGRQSTKRSELESLRRQVEERENELTMKTREASLLDGQNREMMLSLEEHSKLVGGQKDEIVEQSKATMAMEKELAKYKDQLRQTQLELQNCEEKEKLTEEARREMLNAPRPSVSVQVETLQDAPKADDDPSGTIALLEEERDYLLQSIEEFESKLLSLDEHVQVITDELAKTKEALQDVTNDKIQAIDMAEMLVRQRMDEADVAITAINNHQINPLPPGVYPAGIENHPPVGGYPGMEIPPSPFFNPMMDPRRGSMM